MPNPENNSIPYLKGMLTLSILMLIYVYGDAQIKSTLTIALVGLEIRNPDILGQMVFIALTWYIIRFWRTGIDINSWAFRVEFFAFFNRLLKQESYRNIINPIALRANFPGKVDDTTAIPTFNYGATHRGFFSRSIVVKANFGDPTRKAPEPYIKLNWFLWLRIYTHALLKWIFDEDTFSRIHLPFWIAVFALMSSLTAAGLNPFTRLFSL